jgi:hypothetical protein
VRQATWLLRSKSEKSGASRAAVAGPSIGIIVGRRGPYLAIETAGATRTGTASPVARRGHRAEFFRSPGIIQAKVGLRVMMTNVPAARLALGSRDHGGHHYRRTHHQHRKPDRISAHACLLRFRALVKTYIDPMRPSLKFNFIRAPLLGEPATTSHAGLSDTNRAAGDPSQRLRVPDAVRRATLLRRAGTHV